MHLTRLSFDSRTLRYLYERKRRSLEREHGLRLAEYDNFFDNDEFFHKYHPYDGPGGYLACLERLAERFPKLITLDFSQTSTEGRVIPVARVCASRSTREHTFWINSLIHAPEFIGGEVNLGILRKLIEGYIRDDSIFNTAEFFFTPVLNPDGFVRNIENVHHLEFKLGRYNPRGVDLNRNFDDNFAKRSWINKVKRLFGFDLEYAGKHPFSERETQFVRAFVEKIEPSAVVSLHSYFGTILYPPWSSQEEDPWMKELAENMGKAMQEPYDAVPGSRFLEYVAGSPLASILGKLATKIRHPTIEGSLDGWLYQQGIPSMLLEISRPPTLELALFGHLPIYNPPPSSIPFHVENCYSAVRQFMEDIIASVNLTSPRHTVPRTDY